MLNQLLSMRKEAGAGAFPERKQHHSKRHAAKMDKRHQNLGYSLPVGVLYELLNGNLLTRWICMFDDLNLINH
jgi:hypothetical protein